MMLLSTDRLISLVAICEDLIARTNHFTPEYAARASEYMEAVCDACGVSFKSGEEATIQISADKFNLNWEKRQGLQVFQENLVHFFNHYKRFTTNSRQIFRWKFAQSLQKDFDERSVKVFHAMTKNFVDQIISQAGEYIADNNEQKKKECNNNKMMTMNLSVEDLCSGDWEKTLCLVPSRELARKMGLSDQKLRREIYLARQRALKKRPTPIQKPEMVKLNHRETKSTNNFEDFETYFDLEIPTCASPPSSTTSSENEMETVTSNNATNIEWSIESIIKSDLFEC